MSRPGASRASRVRQRLEAQRSTHPVIDAVFSSIELHSQSGGALLAGALAFRFFLFLIPCVFVFVIGLGLGADVAGADLKDVARSVGITGVAAKAMQSGADASDFTRWLTFAIAVVTLVVGARNLVKALWLAHALIWRIPVRKVRHPTLAGLALIVGFAALSLLVRGVQALHDLSFAGWVAGVMLFTLVPAAGWLLCSAKLFPRPATATWQHLWPGAVVFGVGVQALHLATIFWVAPSIESKSQAYGAIGAALTLLLWAYMVGRLVTTTAALNAASWRRAVTGAAAAPPTEASDVGFTPTGAGRSSGGGDAAVRP